MSNRIGRPPVSKEKAKAVLYGARVAREDVPKIERGVQESGQTPSQLIRKALDDAARLDWSRTSKWTYEDLNGQPVEYSFWVPRKNGFVRHEGLGEFVVYAHRDPSKLSIRIQVDLLEGHGVRSIVFCLRQRQVDLIELHPQQDIARFRCFESKP